MHSDPSQVAKNAWLEGVSYERKLDLVAAIAALSKAVDLHPDDAAYVSRLSKQWSDISYIDGTSHQDARKANTKALELAQQVSLGILLDRTLWFYLQTY